jgi:plastocyanin
LAIVAAACWSIPVARQSTSGSAAAPVEVRIVEPADDPYSWRFEPADLTVSPGATVVWRNAGAHVHTVTADDGSFSSPNLAPGATWRWRFENSGGTPYHCSPHPWMKARVRVRSAGGT